MYEDQKKYNEIGGKNEILFFINLFYRIDKILVSDYYILCSRAQIPIKPIPDALLYFFKFIGFIDIDDTHCIVINVGLRNQIFENRDFINDVIAITISRLFQTKILDTSHFFYNSQRDSYSFKNELFPLEHSALRNFLISCGFLVVEHDNGLIRYIVSDNFNSILADLSKKNHVETSIDKFREQMLRNELAGELAEQFVLDYEKKRLNYCEISSRIKQISLIDVGAGYDILSFHDEKSTNYDRFIEVKAVSRETSFYWSSNEYSTAKLRGKDYFLYLVELDQICIASYIPKLIQDPANVIMESDNWLIEAESYKIRWINI